MTVCLALALIVVLGTVHLAYTQGATIEVTGYSGGCYHLASTSL